LLCALLKLFWANKDAKLVLMTDGIKFSLMGLIPGHPKLVLFPLIYLTASLTISFRYF
jgi:hypothetical protein